jgi:hypothetical protein
MEWKSRGTGSGGLITRYSMIPLLYDSVYSMARHAITLLLYLTSGNDLSLFLANK